MSFRELRNFTEILRALGYHRNISMENFRDPNFELVAEILYWFAMRYDPNADISDDIDEKEDRVKFIKQVCQLFAAQARITLNPKRLYEAQGLAVKEMLKIAEMMYKAMKSTEAFEEDETNTQMMDFNTSSKLHNLKAARQLATEITESGAKLFDMLGQERELRESRDKALEFLDSISRNLDQNTEQQYIEKCIRNIIDTQTRKMEEMQETVKSLRGDEGVLQNTIQRRRQELERADKRLKGIENVKPEYQEEYERLEVELERFYATYVEKYTNIDYLEYELDLYNLKDSQRRAKQEQVIEKLKDQHLKNQKDEIFEDDPDDPANDKFNEMRETKTGFGAKVNGNYGAEGGLEPDDDDSDGEDIGDEEEEDGEIGDDDGSEGDDASDHNF